MYYPLFFRLFIIQVLISSEVTAKFPDLLQIDSPNGTVLDGEMVVLDEEGKPDFEYMMEAFRSSRSTYRVQYCVFDVIYSNSNKVSGLPLL